MPPPASPTRQPRNTHLKDYLRTQLAAGETLAPSTIGNFWVNQGRDAQQRATQLFPQEKQQFDIAEPGHPNEPHSQVVTVRPATAQELDHLPRTTQAGFVGVGGPSALYQTTQRALQRAPDATRRTAAPPRFICDNQKASAAACSARQYLPHHPGFPPQVSISQLTRASFMHWWRGTSLEACQSHDAPIVHIHMPSLWRDRSAMSRVGLRILAAQSCPQGNCDAQRAHTTQAAIQSGSNLRSINPELVETTGSIEIAVDAQQQRHLQHHNQALRDTGLQGHSIAPSSLSAAFGFTPQLPAASSAYLFPKSGVIHRNFWPYLESRLQESGGHIDGGWRLSDVLTHKNPAQVCGVKLRNTTGNEVRFIATPQVYASLGSASQFDFRTAARGGQPPAVITAGGISSWALFYGDLKSPILSNGCTWTPIAHATRTTRRGTEEPVTLIRLAGGGLIGGPEIAHRGALSHAARLLFSSEELFGDKRIELLDMRAGGRPVTAKGSMEAIESVPGLVIASGGSSTGFTMSGANPEDL